MSKGSYKLIKKYPGCHHTLGTIIPKGGQGWMGLYGDLEEGLYSEFWELIKEPEFQILAIKTSVKISLTAENTSTEIYKVLRLSDKKTFSVGDKIEHSYLDKDNSTITKTYTIENIYILDDGDIRFYVGGGLNLGLEKLKKYISKALFITEDGVEIFKGTPYFWIYKLKFQSNAIYGPIKSNIAPGNNDLLYFSTEKAAKEYLDLNRPKYSLKDIENAVKSFNWGPFTFDMLKNALNNK